MKLLLILLSAHGYGVFSFLITELPFVEATCTKHDFLLHLFDDILGAVQGTILFSELNEGAGSGGILARLVCGNSTTPLPYSIRDSCNRFPQRDGRCRQCRQCTRRCREKWILNQSYWHLMRRGSSWDIHHPICPPLAMSMSIPVSIRHQSSPAPLSNL